MAGLHRQMEIMKDELARRDDKDEKFANVEKLIKKIALGLLGAIIAGFVIYWFCANRNMKTLTAYIARLATSKITVSQVLELVPT